MEKYYYGHNNQQLGPFSLEELKIKGINRTTLVWREGLPDWVEAESLDELKSIFKTMPPPLPKQKKETVVETVVVKPPTIKKDNPKHDNTYKNDYGDVFCGVIFFIAPIVTWFVLSNSQLYQDLNNPELKNYYEDYPDHYKSATGQYSQTLLVIGVIFLSIRIIASYWAGKIAYKKNRKINEWRTLGFFFPGISLIAIGLMQKLRLVIEVDGSLSKTDQIKFLLEKAKNLYKANRPSECIDVLKYANNIDNSNVEIIELIKQAEEKLMTIKEPDISETSSS